MKKFVAIILFIIIITACTMASTEKIVDIEFYNENDPHYAVVGYDGQINECYCTIMNENDFILYATNNCIATGKLICCDGLAVKEYVILSCDEDEVIPMPEKAWIYNPDVTMMVVCGYDESLDKCFTAIVEEEMFIRMAEENILCSAYEIFCDGFAEIDWTVNRTGVWTWYR